jgi:hypothetical protein
VGVRTLVELVRRRTAELAAEGGAAPAASPARKPRTKRS